MIKLSSELINRIFGGKSNQCEKCLKYTESGSKVLRMCWPCVFKVKEQILNGEIKLIKKYD